MTDETQHIRIHVHPEPDPEEIAAIVAAVSALVSRRNDAGREEQPSRVNGRTRWASAGRREVLRSTD